MFDKLSIREKQILQSLIDHYISTADPVGSRVIANKYQMGLSPATIRNTMQDLEELGLIKQPHTSAGRIPTDTGYRVFVDMLLKQEPLTESEKRKIRKIVSTKSGGIDNLLSQTSRVMCEITNQLGITIAPRFDKGLFKRIDLVPVASDKILSVITVESGLVHSILMEMESTIDLDELQKIETVLNERLAGQSLGHIRHSITERLADTSCSPKLLKLFINPQEDIWAGRGGETLHVIGTENLISQPEFADRSRLMEIVKFLEKKDDLINLIESRSFGEGIVITIGSESSINEIQNCSLVTSTYRVGKLSGTIGIIGPTRMPYSRLVSIVEYTARSLSEALSESRGKNE